MARVILLTQLKFKEQNTFLLIKPRGNLNKLPDFPYSQLFASVTDFRSHPDEQDVIDPCELLADSPLDA